jgi:hypothetical protein
MNKDQKYPNLFHSLNDNKQILRTNIQNPHHSEQQQQSRSTTINKEY